MSKEDGKLEIGTLQKGPIMWYEFTANFVHIPGWIWPTMVAVTPKDSKEDSLFHAIALACFKPYVTGVLRGERINKDKIVSDMRTEMAQKLNYGTGMGESRVYDMLNGGHRIPISYDELYSQFLGTSSTSVCMLEHISNCINRDIYIYDHNINDLWYTGDESFRLQDRNSILLYRENNEIYSVVGIKKEDDVVFSHFSPSCEFITFLKFRLKQIADKVSVRDT